MNILACYQNILVWFCLINSPQVGPKTFWEMLKKYHTAEKALQYVQNPFPKKEAEKILKTFNGYVLLATDTIFPKELKRDPSCPPMLFARGDLKVLQYQKIAIIGARNASLAGKAIAANLGEALSDYYAIVSGLATGIDTSAHLGALKNRKCRPIAVMPFSLDNIYPKENKDLFERIVKNGLVITEVPPHRNPDQGMFHARNRIVANLSSGIIVIEAALKSGTISTAKLALDLGVDVMAVPGCPADPRARGCNYLIKNGAPLIESYTDVLENMNTEITTLKEETILKYTVHNPENTLNQDILDMLSADIPTNIESIAEHLNMKVSNVLCNISELEMSGKIKRYSTNEVILNV